MGVVNSSGSDYIPFDTGNANMDLALTRLCAKLGAPLIVEKAGAMCHRNLPVVSLNFVTGAGTTLHAVFNTNTTLPLYRSSLNTSYGTKAIPFTSSPPSEESYVVGSLKENTVQSYIRWEAFNGMTADLIFEILDKLYFGELLAAKAFIAEYTFAQEKADWIARLPVVKAIEADSTKLKNSIKSLETTIESYTRDTLAHIAQRETYLKQLNEKTQLSTDVRDVQDAQADRLMTLMGTSIERVLIENGFINVLTTPIYLEGIQLGKFWILMAPSPGGVVKLVPESERFVMRGYAHPHIYSDGQVCLGTAATTLNRLRTAGRYTDAIQLLLQFLRSYNANNCYVKLEAWKEPNGKASKVKVSDLLCSKAAEVHPQRCVRCSLACANATKTGEACFTRITADSAWYSCVTCGKCSHTREAEKKCQASKARNCMTCPINSCQNWHLRTRVARRKKVEEKSGD